MVRLARTIGFPKLILTGVFGLMVRSRRTMKKKGKADARSPRHFRAHGA
jgi:hypothetical protein